MKPNAIHAKTAAGQHEIAHRSSAIDARHRTLLIMVDGHRSFADLAPLMGGAGALEPMLARLVALGMIAAAG
ncbi:hypothetical protein QFW77_00325 [Luteimonas sp. RD2P54]|uniref:Uncharacterized protein n=1 Tax=Luteimonas endophytica TaxID=3042023 RepID=A0ABT6J3N9_9GAMM|nr:hypothetical protein [Luteimonas endophytica]MDH5821440.1 hypothetical protein [Luteimonas endophytica]